ncbi:MAG: DUF4349 domain-containing protein [Actinomycetota bacterium]
MRRILVITLLLVAALGMVGCTSSGGSSGSGPSGTTRSGGPASAPDRGTAVTGGGAVSPPTAARSVITTGTISITVDRPSVAADEAARIADAAGGRVDGRNERPATEGVPGSAQLVLRIPSAKLDGALQQLKRLGRVEKVSLATQDVTGVTQDLDARITALSTSVGRLTELMSRATTTADLISIESALAERQSNLESLTAQRRGLTDQVDLATLTVDFGTAATAPVRPPATFVSGVVAGWGTLVSFFSALLVVVGVLLPWMIVAAVLGGILILVWRRIRTTHQP